MGVSFIFILVQHCIKVIIQTFGLLTEVVIKIGTNELDYI